MSPNRLIFFVKAILIALPIALTLVDIRSAHAQWVVKASGPDVFGNEKVVALVPSASGDALIVQCDQKDKLYFALIEPASESERNDLSGSDGLPATLLVRVDQGNVHKFSANLRQWNNKYLGIVVSGRRPRIVSLLREIGLGNRRISIGSELFGSRFSESFGVIGSGNAMNTVIKDCKLANIKVSPGEGNGKSFSPAH